VTAAPAINTAVAAPAAMQRAVVPNKPKIFGIRVPTMRCSFAVQVA